MIELIQAFLDADEKHRFYGAKAADLTEQIRQQIPFGETRIGPFTLKRYAVPEDFDVHGVKESEKIELNGQIIYWSF